MDAATGQENRFLQASRVLRPILLVLDRFNHRHKNQHQIARWWAEFDLLRRSVRRLLRAIDGCEQHHKRVSSRFVSKSKPDKSQGSLREDVAAGRAQWLSGQVIWKSYLPFTQLAADPQHAALGLLLLGLLAAVRAALEPLAPQPRPLSPSPAPIPNPLTHKKDSDGAGSPDLGVVVARADVGHPAGHNDGADENRLGSNPQPPRSRTVKESTCDSNEHLITPQRRSPASNLASEDSGKTRARKRKEAKPKKKRKGDEFSNLFGSL